MQVCSVCLCEELVNHWIDSQHSLDEPFGLANELEADQGILPGRSLWIRSIMGPLLAKNEKTVT